ncbi:MAG TPA: DUF3096 domain-containing protein [Candidatus Nanoarchaeia archaeon]|nr:DUF3096 domain-containing protein [Candidatus Nanoarchaeia archaeon]
MPSASFMPMISIIVGILIILFPSFIRWFIGLYFILVGIIGLLL